MSVGKSGASPSECRFQAKSEPKLGTRPSGRSCERTNAGLLNQYTQTQTIHEQFTKLLPR